MILSKQKNFLLNVIYKHIWFYAITSLAIRTLLARRERRSNVKDNRRRDSGASLSALLGF